MPQKKNKYLFLDIDGVLNHDDWFKSATYKNCKENWKVSMFDPECVNRVNRILSETGAILVVSSSWRTMTDLKEIFEGVGLPKMFYRTPEAYDVLGLDTYECDDPSDERYWRGSEIKYWLDFHDPHASYAIIDDDTDMLEEQKEYFIQTSSGYQISPELYIANSGSGLTDAVMRKAIKILNDDGRI